MAFDDNDEFGDEDAKGLRKELGKLGSANKAMAEKLAAYEAKDLIASKGFTLVKPEEIASLDEDKREARAKELHEERQTQQADLLRSAFKGRIEDEEELEGLVKELLGQREQTSPEGQQVSRARELGTLDSQPIPLDDPRKLHGQDAILHGLTSKK